MAVLYLLLTMCASAVWCGTVSVANKNMNVNKDNPVSLSYFIQYPPEEKFNVIDIYLKDPVSSVETILAQGLSNSLKLQGSFGGKYSTSVDVSAKKYTLTINDAQYTDSAIYKAIAVFLTKTGELSVKNVEIALEVNGGPEFCNLKPPETLTVISHERPRVRVSVCGNPEPQITWEYLGNNLKSTIIKGKKPKEFIFETLLPQITPPNCGSSLTYKATGHGRGVSDRTILNVKFTPENVKVTEAYLKEQCVTVRFTTLDVGTCKLSYEFNYFDDRAQLVGSSAADKNTNTVQQCGITASTVKARARSSDSVGQWSAYPINSKNSGSSIQPSRSLWNLILSIAILITLSTL
ncbi:uncharacterized protein LOC130636304 [Hydractinia symbiolongicarpus]|uniref:uncharacterized protein LOC130636304 n=1 Tax=Hydractinia symbiolongicarpus TaxID=13093 RepID=UPI00254FCE72|nr:uncharacterized protein LOC130636304 [Hydractinia symbiolongicarpus]